MIGRGGTSRGRWAETVARWVLALRGHRLLDRNFRGGGGEIDLVTRHRGTTVFVEVKARSSGAFGGAAAAVDADKRRRLARAAESWLLRHRAWDRPARFDVVTVQRLPRFPWWRVRVWPNAFDAPDPEERPRSRRRPPL